MPICHQCGRCLNEDVLTVRPDQVPPGHPRIRFPGVVPRHQIAQIDHVHILVQPDGWTLYVAPKLPDPPLAEGKHSRRGTARRRGGW